MLSEKRDNFNLLEKSDKLMFNIISSCFFGIKLPEEYIKIYHEACDITANTSILNFEKDGIREHREKFKKMSEFINEFINNDKDQKFLNVMKKSGMSNSQILDESLTVLGAGFETTSALNMWTLIHLSQNKEVVEKIRNEMPDWVVHNRIPNLNEIFNCSTLNKVIKETLRLNPPAYFTNRIANQDVKISDLEIKKGTNIFASQYITHRIEDYYEDPESWNPYRWTEDFEKSLPKGAYFPFGYGSKKCIGEHFANIAVTMFLLMLIHKFDFELSWSNPSINYAVAMVPDGELTLKLGRRSDGEF
jgi:cytochrome P450